MRLPFLKHVKAVVVSGLLLTFGLSLGTSDTVSSRRVKSRPPTTEAAWVLKNHVELVRLKASFSKPGTSQPYTVIPSDLAVQISAGGADIDALLRLGNGRRPTNGRSLFRARVLVVANGRLHRGGVAWCGAWIDNSSTCRVDCDGGEFTIYRDGNDPQLKTIRLGVDGPRVQSAARFDSGFAISGCAWGDGPDIRLRATNIERGSQVTLIRGDS